MIPPSTSTLLPPFEVFHGPVYKSTLLVQQLLDLTVDTFRVLPYFRRCICFRNSQVGLVGVALYEGIHVGRDGASLSYEEQEQQQEGQEVEGGVAAAPREISKIAFGSCT